MTDTLIAHPEQDTPVVVQSGWDRSDPDEWALRPGLLERILRRLR